MAYYFTVLTNKMFPYGQSFVCVSDLGSTGVVLPRLHVFTLLFLMFPSPCVLNLTILLYLQIAISATVKTEVTPPHQCNMGEEAGL